MRSGRELRRGLATTTGPSEAERSASRRRRREHSVARSVKVISVRREVASRSRFSPPRAVGRADGELQPRDAWPHEEKFGQRSYRAPRRDRLAGWGGSGGRGPAKRVTRSRAVHRRRIERAFGSSSSRTVGGRPTGRTRRSRLERRARRGFATSGRLSRGRSRRWRCDARFGASRRPWRARASPGPHS